MKKIVILISTLLFFVSCMAEKTTKKVNQDSANLQQSKAQKAFEELDKETGESKTQGKSLETKPQETKPIIKETPATKSIIQEKESPNKIAEKELIKDSYPMRDGKPIWFWEPNYNGYLGAVGIARKNAAPQGYAGQKRLAKTLAMAELAKQIKVVVDTEANLERTQISSNTKAYYQSKFSTGSKHKAEEIIQDAVIKDEFVDPANGDLYIWLVIEK